MPVSSPPANGTHHGLAPHEVVLLLNTDQNAGLTSREAHDRLDRYGHNTLPSPARGGVLKRLARQFENPLVYVLVAAGIITLILGEHVDSIVIFGVVIANTAVGFAQESKAEASLEGLRAMIRTSARVIRDGSERALPAEHLVPGDLVVVEAGDRIPADVRLIRGVELRVDESAITGESEPVIKDEIVLPRSTPVADRHNMLYSGTLATSGTGVGVVVATGEETELGEIHRLVGSADTLATPLTTVLTRFSKILTMIILGLAALTFATGIARGQDPVDMFTAAIALAVGMIPEGLPAAVTITLAIGVARMAKRGAVIRRLPAVETLGSTTVICSDKTGTLTQNQMTVRDVWTADAHYSVTGNGYSPHGDIRPVHDGVVSSCALQWTLRGGMLCSDAALTAQGHELSLIGDPTEGAMIVAALKGGVDLEDVKEQFPRVATIPFSSERQYMATLHTRAHTVATVTVVKGAVEKVLGLCTGQMDSDGAVSPIDHASVVRAAEALAGRGLRVIAIAMGEDPTGRTGSFTEQTITRSLVLTGLQGMHDPPRTAAAAAVRACHTAGVAVKMITGDHAVTASAIARDLNIMSGEQEGAILSGNQIAQLDGGELADAAENATVFARVSPEQKLRLVEALQARGHVVAMTGDGVNDAPALQQANIGVAMGRSGTEVAKDAADMVITDDDFSTVEAAVEEGRGVFDNLTKFILWSLPTNLAEGLIILVAIVLGTTLPILPTQILWINMTTAIALGLMLAFEPQEQGIMSRPPRDPSKPLLSWILLSRILLVAGLLVIGTWIVFNFERANGVDLAAARTAAVNFVVVVEILFLLSCRSLTRSAWSLGVLSNRWIIYGISAQTLGQLALTYVPSMNHLFHTAPIAFDSWLRIVAVAAATYLVISAEKFLRRHQLRPTG